MKTTRHSLPASSRLPKQRHPGTLAVTAAITLSYLSGCAVEPLTAAPARAAATLERTVQVYVYPTKAQSDAQLDRDRYECHQWAFQQTHFDPSSSAGGHAPVVVVSRPAPGVNTAAGAIAGAVLGAVIAGPHDAAAGVVAGAITGAAIGAASDSKQQRSVEQQQYAQHDQRELAQGQDYRRALSACLEGRGYTVR